MFFSAQFIIKFVTKTSEKPIKNPRNQEIYKQAKLDLLDTLDLDIEKTLVNRCNLADAISDTRYKSGIESGIGIPKWPMDLRLEEPKFSVNLDDELNKHQDIKDEYLSLIDKKPSWFERRLQELDTILAERIILDNGGSIEFKESDKDKFLDKKPAEEES